jgi:hypothetical protein
MRKLQLRQWGKGQSPIGPVRGKIGGKPRQLINDKEPSGTWTRVEGWSERRVLLGSLRRGGRQQGPPFPNCCALNPPRWSADGGYGGARKFSSGVRKLCSNWRTLIKALARASACISNNSRLKVTSGIRV